jgi:hypothetical protein
LAGIGRNRGRFAQPGNAGDEEAQEGCPGAVITCTARRVEPTTASV